ncbi:GtrA family protein [Phyllobacterium sp. SYP-B3895]|uniref:GtrA family protein n=1 Tax=Phyllobacterium sp. SYP-B3895 TaxID=2663240 RepID=UPI001299FBAD|nr:GtrA family protein [Phyllobacterium sp. SYP-B3895]MRG55126.1 GtrA family protein [Phyllobacterium sp. SYP-B3895]
MRERAISVVGSPFVRFVISGGIAAAINILSRIAFSQFLPFSAAIVLAFLVGMTTAFILMKQFVFEESGNSTGNEYVRFGLVNLVALLQVWLVSIILARWLFPAINYNWHVDTTAHVVGVLSPVLTSYVAHKSFTFAGTGR